jgi:hypothetical protein
MPTAIESAIADPIGLRVAWSDWGATIGWQAQQYGPVKFPAGRVYWLKVIHNTEPAQLGMAWQALEERENHEHNAQEPEWPKVQNKKEEGKEVPVIQYTEVVTMAPGYYPAQIKEIEVTTGEFGPQLKFIFSILDGDNKPVMRDSGTPEEQWAWCSQKWGPRTKLLEWGKVILKAKCPGPGEPIDTDLLIGKRCDIEIVEKETPNGTRTRIERLMPFRSMSNQAEDES